MPRIAISGCGPVGSTFLRVALERGLEVAALHDVGDLADGLDEALLPQIVVIDAQSDPDWTALDVDVVVDCGEGVRSRGQLAAHLAAGAAKVVAAGPVVRMDATVVMAVNDATYRTHEHDVISNASALVHAVAPLLQVLDAEFGVQRGFVTTTYADARLAALEEVLPALADRVEGARFDVASGATSFCDLTLLLARAPDLDDVNAALRIAARGRLAGVLRYSDRPLAAEDVDGDPASAVIDSTLTRASGELVKVMAWFDPVWASANRLADVVSLVCDRLEPSSLPVIYSPSQPDVVLAPTLSPQTGAWLSGSPPRVPRRRRPCGSATGSRSVRSATGG